MAEYHFPIPGSVDEAKIVLFVHRHWGSFIGQFCLSLVMLAAPIIISIVILTANIKIGGTYMGHFMVLGFSIYYLIAISVIFIFWISYYYDIYVITEDAIIDITQEGFFGRKISQLSLLRVQDVTSNIKGVLPTLFGFGDVLVETAGEQSQNFLLKAVPNPQEVSAKIMELHNGIIETEGRHHQVLEAEGALAPGTIKEEVHPTDEGHPMAEEKKETTYQDLLKKEESSTSVQENPPTLPSPPPSPPPPPIENLEKPANTGEVSHEDLDKGGEIELK